MNHAVKTFKPDGTLVYEEYFETADKAYEEYRDTVDNLTRHLPKGQIIIVARFNHGKLMTQYTVTGKA